MFMILLLINIFVHVPGVFQRLLLLGWMAIQVKAGVYPVDNNNYTTIFINTFLLVQVTVIGCNYGENYIISQTKILVHIFTSYRSEK